VRKADSLTVILEPTVYTMWELRRLTDQQASAACHRDSFTSEQRSLGPADTQDEKPTFRSFQMPSFTCPAELHQTCGQCHSLPGYSHEYYASGTLELTYLSVYPRVYPRLHIVLQVPRR
jgi:hypothetical protein